MVLNLTELSLDLKPNCIFTQSTIGRFVGAMSEIGDVSERIARLDDFVGRLEEEMKKIDVFKRELPLCVRLINDAILALKEESLQLKKSNAKLVLAEFMPLKKRCKQDGNDEIVGTEKDPGDKKNWLSSTHLWNTNQEDPNTLSNHTQKQNPTFDSTKIVERGNQETADDDLFKLSRTSRRGFVPFKGNCVFPVIGSRKEDKEIPSHELSLNLREELRHGSLVNSETSNNETVSCSAPNFRSSARIGAMVAPQQASRKQRRCWSPELHRKFVDALQKLGGSNVATPKQIRELMQVDGLTNDEVKSHLQKFRVHTRRVSTSTSSPTHQPPVGWWTTQDQHSETSKQRNFQSSSPQGPLQLNAAAGGTLTAGNDSMEDEENEKSESCSCKNHLNASDKHGF